MIVGIAVVISLVGTGCSTVVDPAVQDPSETGTSPELIKQATDFGRWTLPANAKVLLVKNEMGRAPRCRIALEMTPADLSWMLEKSRYSAARVPGSGSSRDTIAGPDPKTSPNLLHGRDNIKASDGNTVWRKVLIDERDANTRFVHLEFLDI
ncbi:hypothetical protein C5E45_10190 [Nocardia nova]|uniref:Uncharacterized protein n=1 Tax=Nocardia nova TaxID=37330 RepID=A0A2S6ATQ7_9NOCA|nr:hypothetical protein [Nocardia nova]PPJ18213.1 hypothetical protein C5E41_32600 [Nocardia nova]PPJ38584.1 hypothetical protein C5E45_10190 [Nocardia nova]